MNASCGHRRWKFFFFLTFQFLFQAVYSAVPSIFELSLEEKVGQLLMVHFHGEEANEDARRLIQELHVGGIIYYNWANGLHNPRQVACLSQGLQKMGACTPHGIPVLIAADQEGGVVNRLKNGFTLFPSNYAVGLSGELSWGKECARIMGQELKAVGVSMNLAPDADVYTNPSNPVIGIRAFSSDPSEVALWASSALQGYRKAGIVAALKHFPGHGDASVDSHEAVPLISKNREELDRCELLPFRTLAGEADAILTAHLMFPALDPDHCATFSKKIMEGVLRKEFNFQGVIMTDSLAMQGILSQCSSLEEAVLKSLEAGHDLILLGGKQLLATQSGLEFTIDDVQRVCQSLVEAVQTGRLSEKRVDEAVGRILRLKEKARLFEATPYLEDKVGTKEHLAFAGQIARQALRLGKGKSFLPLSRRQPILAIAPDFLQDEMDQTSWSQLGSQGKIIYFKGLNPDQDCIQEITEKAGDSPICVFFAYQAWNSREQQELFEAIRKTASFVLAIVLRDPVDEKVLSSSDVLLYTYGPVSCSLQAAFDYLYEKP